MESVRKRLRLGDVFRMIYPGGSRYVQYANNHWMTGPILRVFPPAPKLGSLKEIESLVAGPHEFFVCVFVTTEAMADPRLLFVCNMKVPDFASKLPLFRTCGKFLNSQLAPNDHVIDAKPSSDWDLWDGETYTHVGCLTLEQINFPIHETWSLGYCINRFEEGWTPQTDPRNTLRSR